MNVAAELNLEAEIEKLKRSMNAVILAHYYQESEIQDVADFVGDSLALAQQAAEDDGRRDRLLRRSLHGRDGEDPEPDEASCCCRTSRPAARSSDRCPPDQFRAFKDKHPDAFVVSYVNCSAAVKAMSDVICTSSQRGEDRRSRSRRTRRSSSRPTNTSAATSRSRPGAR